MSFKEQFQVDLDAVAPYSFELTIRKPAGWWWSTPNEVYKNGVCWTATRFGEKLLGLKIKGLGTIQKPKIRCNVYSKSKKEISEKQNITNILRRALKTEEDLAEFYSLGQKDPTLQGVVEDLYGMRTIGWPELFPALILAITLQMAPMKRSNQMMDLIMANYGEVARFDGESIRYWPSAQRIAALPDEQLRAKAKLGYRAANLVAVAKSIIRGFPTMDDLWKMEPQEAKQRLMTLRGIGDYSAELVMPRMGFPLDVWSAKIFSVLFKRDLPQNPREAIAPLKKLAEQHWGDWRGYAFVYILNDLENLSKKIGFDLTEF